MDSQRFRELPVFEQALVCVAVLLDGREAAVYLENDRQNAGALKQAALDLAALDPELRMALLGTWLRTSLAQVST